MMADSITDPIETEAPDDSGSVTLRRYSYQVHIAVQAVLEMLAGGAVEHVTCEHIEDILVARRGDPRCADGSLFWDFQQIKTRDAVEPWSLADMISKRPLKSLWRTHTTVRNTGLVYQLTAGIEGHLDPGDSGVTALSKGLGAQHAACRRRVAKHLEVPEDGALDEFLTLIRVRTLVRREDVEARNTRVLADLGPKLPMSVIDALYNELLRRTFAATEGRPPERWTELLATDSPSPKVLGKRITARVVDDVRQRLTRPDHVLLEDVSASIQGSETALVRKLRQGAASSEVIEEAQMLRAQADHHRLREQALGTWPDDSAFEMDLDERLLILVRRTARAHKELAKPADGIFDGLQQALLDNPSAYDRRPLYAQDSVLLMGRACAVSDECRFNWGDARDAS
ncbi:dsDNA nuclease domain-containing protein [Streptomyces sp. P6-2-1]|uniref:dsDNA nuclease domain-containing protein n=1 Tax=Streptomyces sp. P6-2-1 TaxID=3422591 RepID=UPI003D365EEB